MHSDLKGLRDRASAKAKRLASGDSKGGKVDASSFTPYSDPTDTDVQTGMKPISRRAFRAGGKVASMEGNKAKKNVGAKPRKAGNAPTTPVSMANRDMKQANSARPGPKVVGAMKKGGSVHEDVAADKKLIKSMVKPAAIKKADGGKILHTKKNPDGSQQYIKGETRYDRNKTVEKGRGAAYDKLWSSDDPAEKEKMRGARVRLEFADHDDSRYKKGGRTKRTSGGQTVNRAGKGDYAGDYPSDMSASKAAEIRAKQESDAKRERQWESTTAVGKKRGGEVHGDDCGCKMCCGGSVKDRSKRASGGRLEDALGNAAKVGAMGGGLLPMGIAAAMGAMDKKKNGGRAARKSGGRVGKTNINIVISPKAEPVAGPMPAPMPPAPVPPAMVGRPPMPPGGGGIPPQLVAALAAGRGPAGMPAASPPRPYRRGGKVYSSYKDMDAGAGSAEGRLEKTEIAARSRR